MNEISLEPVGVVRNDVTERGERRWQHVASKIVIKNNLGKALDNIEEFSHIIVLYWMHKVDKSQRSILKVHPQSRQELPLVGVFASRSPARPNPIGMSIVKLVSRKKNILNVIGLDALDGTQVLDIKPYIPSHDANLSAQTPQWIKTIHRLSAASQKQ